MTCLRELRSDQDGSTEAPELVREAERLPAEAVPQQDHRRLVRLLDETHGPHGVASGPSRKIGCSERTWIEFRCAHAPVIEGDHAHAVAGKPRCEVPEDALRHPDPRKYEQLVRRLAFGLV